MFFSLKKLTNHMPSRIINLSHDTACVCGLYTITVIAFRSKCFSSCFSSSSSRSFVDVRYMKSFGLTSPSIYIFFFVKHLVMNTYFSIYMYIYDDTTCRREESYAHEIMTT